MKKGILTTLILLSGLTSFGQINMADSTAQVISYWEKGEKKKLFCVIRKNKN